MLELIMMRRNVMMTMITMRMAMMCNGNVKARKIVTCAISFNNFILFHTCSRQRVVVYDIFQQKVKVFFCSVFSQFGRCQGSGLSSLPSGKEIYFLIAQLAKISCTSVPSLKYHIGIWHPEAPLNNQILCLLFSCIRSGGKVFNSSGV